MNNNFKIVVEHVLRTENIATEAIAIAHEATQKPETSEEIATEANGEAADDKQIAREARDSADDCDTRIYRFECEINKLKKKVAEAEDYSRKRNLKIDGLQASLTETDAQLMQNMYRLFQNQQGIANASNMNFVCHLLGKIPAPTSQSPRPTVIVQLSGLHEWKIVWDKRQHPL